MIHKPGNSAVRRDDTPHFNIWFASNRSHGHKCDRDRFWGRTKPSKGKELGLAGESIKGNRGRVGI